MPNKRGVVNCRGNYNKENRRRVFRLPKEQSERQKWLNVLSPRENFVVNPDKFFICEIHWGADPPLIKLRGGSMRPGISPSIFTVPASYLPSPKLTPRPAKVEGQQLRYFLQKDKVTSFDAFKPECNLQKQYKNLIISRLKERLVCLFMTDNFIRQTVRLTMNNDIPFDKTIQNVVTLLQAHTSADVDNEKEKKLVFLTLQLELFSQKQFSMDDYCFAPQSYPKCNYDQLRDFLVLPCKLKLQYITSSIDEDQILRETFDKVQTLQQMTVFLLVDEVQIRPTVSFSGRVLSGMAKNNRDCKATSMRCVMMKSLHKGPSLMISMTPVHKLTATYQLERVKEAAAAVERVGGRIIGSITDNHKVSQQYCKLFDRLGDCSATAKHPLDNERVSFLIFDTVHLLKCIRHNWISEKGQKISLDNETTA
ncbi:Zinc finger C2CH-type [Trinorchestia longiramus]|nr:Zinc finger C2CH-type [Trinorchestia longiramus]